MTLCETESAFTHTRPGGAAIFAPDCLRESFHERSGVIQGDDGPRALRCLEWHHDPDPTDETYVVDFAFLLRHGQSVRSVHGRHAQGLFARDTWLRLLVETGHRADIIARPLDEAGRSDQIFLRREAPTGPPLGDLARGRGWCWIAPRFFSLDHSSALDR